MKLTLHEELGRCYEFADASAPDVTVVGYDPRARTVRLHAADGGRQVVELALFERAVIDGAIVVSAKAPFVHAAETRFDRLRAERAKHRDAVGIAKRGGFVPRLVYRNGGR